MATKEFDWEQAKKQNSPRMFQLLKSTHDKPISEEDFVTMFKSTPRGDGSVTRRSPSRGRAMYRNLRDKFGFFNGAS